MNRSALVMMVLLVSVAAAKGQEPSTDWPCWRGPKADGVAEGRNLPTRWSKTENIRWSVPLPGWGTSSPVVHGNRVFVTSHVKAGKKALLTLCFDRQTGKELWRHDFGFGVEQRTHEKSTLAVNTPAVTPDAVYVAFGNADIARYSHDGKLIWVNRYMTHFGDPKMAWGYGVSPLVLEDSVLFPWNHHKGPCYLVGLDKGTGKIAWKKERPIGTAHATPLLVEHHGQKDILVPGQNRLTAFEARTHEELWRYGEGAGPFNGEIISSPVYGDGMVFLQLWRESKIHAIRLNGQGKPPETVWVSKKPGPVESSVLYYRGLLYAWMDNGVLVCLDGKTGEELYRERLGAAANSSPIASDGHIYVSDNDGKTFIVQAGRTFKLLTANPLGERISASPAITGNWLIYRTDSHLYCIGSLLAQEPAKMARQKLVGVWAGYAVEGKGEKPNQGPVKLELTITPDLIQAKQFKGENILDLGEGTFEITLDKSPHYLDGNKKLENANRKEIWLGIYQLEGDTLKWCVGKKTRPTEFETKKGAFLLILKRKSK